MEKPEANYPVRAARIIAGFRPGENEKEFFNSRFLKAKEIDSSIDEKVFINSERKLTTRIINHGKLEAILLQKLFLYRDFIKEKAGGSWPLKKTGIEPIVSDTKETQGNSKSNEPGIPFHKAFKYEGCAEEIELVLKNYEFLVNGNWKGDARLISYASDRCESLHKTMYKIKRYDAWYSLCGLKIGTDISRNMAYKGVSDNNEEVGRLASLLDPIVEKYTQSG